MPSERIRNRIEYCNEYCQGDIYDALHSNYLSNITVLETASQRSKHLHFDDILRCSGTEVQCLVTLCPSEVGTPISPSCLPAGTMMFAGPRWRMCFLEFEYRLSLQFIYKYANAYARTHARTHARNVRNTRVFEYNYSVDQLYQY